MMTQKGVPVRWMLLALDEHEAKYGHLAPDKQPCLVWPFCLSSSGYASIGFRKKSGRVSRSAYEFTGRVLLPGYHACHSCDNRACINPAHLFAGTQTDNMRDCANKGRLWMQNHPERLCRGSRHGRSKLTEAQVSQILKLARSGRSQTSIAKQYGISQPNVSLIFARKGWVHLPPAQRENAA